MRSKKLPSLLSAASMVVVMVLAGVAAAVAYANVVYYTGQGVTADGFGGYDLKTELCGVENGADVDGPYLLWVLTATGASHANITGPWGTVEMTKKGNGAFQYISGWYDPSTLFPQVVFATYDGKAKNAQLVISHGCRPNGSQGAWCSPGFWRNARDGAWALTGKNRTDLFNTSVYDFWYGATFSANPTLQIVLNDPPTYSGPPLAGTSGYQLNAFNATGAYLTNNIPGYQFDWNVMIAGDSNACPIDSFGHFKQ
jgi:hypothetical protein